jgi:mono/diheme cytochrome c family protein
VALPDDEESIAEGQRQAAIRACTECHGPDLTGGVFIDDPALGTIYTSNLTPGGVVADYTIEDWDRAVRHGLDQTGRPLLVMPSLDYVRISDEDLGRMVAYMESLPPSDAAWPESRLGPLGYVLIASGQLPFAAQEIDHSLVQPASVPVAVSAAYGEYLAQTCIGCHGSDFAGGPVPGSGPGDVPAANLTAGGNLGSWSEADFVAAMRTGTTPEGKALDPTVMPWPVTELMTDEELAALWLYFSSLPVVATGG